MYKTLFSLFIALFFVACNSNSNSNSTASNVDDLKNAKLYYGDIKNNRVLVFNITAMELVDTIDGVGEYPYEVTKLSQKEIVSINRKDYGVALIDERTNTITRSVPLDFKPRSLQLKDNHILVSSVSEPSELLFDREFSNGVKYGDSPYVDPTSYGGSYATGHPYWVNENYFLLLDRCEKAVELYKIGSGEPIDKLHTTTSVHHVIYEDGYYYGVMEGDATTAPGILKFTIAYEKIKIIAQRLFSDFSDTNVSDMGAHHLAMHPDGKHIFVPSREGVVYVIKSDDLSLVDTLTTGKGAGHILFSKVDKITYMVTTNHKDIYKSIFDVSDIDNIKKLKDIYFDTEIPEGVTTQSHTTHAIGDRIYFTYNDANTTSLIELNLVDLNISRRLEIPNAQALMGTLVSSLEESTDM